MHSVAITSKNISDGQSRGGRFIKDGRHWMQSFFCLPETRLVIFHYKSNDPMLFKYFYTRLHNDSHIR